MGGFGKAIALGLGTPARTGARSTEPGSSRHEMKWLGIRSTPT